MSTLPGEGPGLPNPVVEDVRDLHGLVVCRCGDDSSSLAHARQRRRERHARAAATGRRARGSRRGRAHRWHALRGAFPGIVSADAAQVGEEAFEDADDLDHGDTLHLDATLRAEQGSISKTLRELIFPGPCARRRRGEGGTADVAGDVLLTLDVAGSGRLGPVGESNEAMALAEPIPRTSRARSCPPSVPTIAMPE